MVLPSGGALLQALAAIPMLPPGRFSTITGCWVRSLKALPMARARMSKAEPAESGTMMRRDCPGASSAAIDAASRETSASAKLTHVTTTFIHDAPEVLAANESSACERAARATRIEVLAHAGSGRYWLFATGANRG